MFSYSVVLVGFRVTITYSDRARMPPTQLLLHALMKLPKLVPMPMVWNEAVSKATVKGNHLTAMKPVLEFHAWLKFHAWLPISRSDVQPSGDRKYNYRGNGVLSNLAASHSSEDHQMQLGVHFSSAANETCIYAFCTIGWRCSD